MKRVVSKYEIPFFDVDAYRIVWHGNYPKYFEISRCALLEEVGCPYSVMEKEGYFFPVVDLQIKYIKPLLFQQKIVIESWLVEWEHRLKINYVIKDSDSNEIYTKAKSCQFAISMPDHITQYTSPPFLTETITKWLSKHDEK